MNLSSPFNLYDAINELSENDYCHPLTTDGYWTWDSSSPPLSPIRLCVSSDGVSYSVQSYTGGQTIAGGVHNPWIDLSGDECGCNPLLSKPSTFLKFNYNIAATPECPAQWRQLRVDIVNSSVTVRRIDACNDPANSEANLYELYGVNPITLGDTAPNVYMQNEWITPTWDIRLFVDRRNLEGCTANATVSDIIHNLGTPISAYSPPSGGLGSSFGPKLTHRITATIPVGACVKSIKVAGTTYGINQVRPASPGGSVWAATTLWAAIDGALPGSHGDEYAFAVYFVGGNTFHIDFLCANSASWIGWDKADANIIVAAGGCGGAESTYNTVVQIMGGEFMRTFSDYYALPCGGNLAVITDLCPNRNESEIINAPSSNYNSIVLQNTSGRRYYIYDGKEPGGEVTTGRVAICQEVNVRIIPLGCSTPPGPADLYWQVAGAENPKAFDPLEEDVAVSDCGGCISEYEFCYPEARDAGHSGAGDGLSCNTGSPTVYEYGVTNDIDKCGGGAVVMPADGLAVYDVPSAFSSCVPNPATHRITSTIPANSLPRTYYVAWRFKDNVNFQWSNFALKRFNYLKGNCCT